MPVFQHVVFDEQTGRHELHFVNQQYDLLGTICWSKEAGDYVEHEGPFGTAAELWGDQLEKTLAHARRVLPKADHDRRGS